MQTKSSQSDASFSIGFLAAVLFGAVIVFSLPFGNWRDIKAFATAFRSTSSVVIGGNSVLKHVSLCDVDHRHLSAMVADQSGLSVADVSYGGQSLMEQTAYLGAALHNPKTKVVVASVAFTEFLRSPLPSLRRRLLFSVAAPTIGHSFTSSGGAFKDFALGADVPLNFRFDGEVFSSYDYIKRRYLTKERAHAGCPEADGFDMRFVKAYYYGNYVNGVTDLKAIRLISDLSKAARQSGRKFLLVLQPIDGELIGEFSGAWKLSVNEQVAAVVSELRQSGVSVLDLTESVPNAAFADRWCACGHLQEEGRRVVAKRIAQSLLSGDLQNPLN